jgi:hypothetical protein
MKKILLLSAISIILSTQTKAQDKPKLVQQPIQPKVYSIGLQVDSAAYIQIMTALLVVELNLNKSTSPHNEVAQSIQLIQDIRKTFAEQKQYQDKPKEQKPKN